MLLADKLHRDGVVCVPLYTRAQLTERRVAFDADIAAMPELKPPHEGETLDDRPLVGGGTAFVGGSICHAPSVRHVEEDAYRVVLDIMRHMAEKLALPRFAQVKDRVCFRPRGMAPSAESAHRDLSPNSPNDRFAIYGGWVPLNDADGQEQCFICVPGTHNDVCERDAAGGFRSLTDAERRTYKARMQRITIPLGHMLLFDQRLVHEVAAIKRPFAIRRVFTAFELSRPDELPLMQRVSNMSASDVRQMFATQGPFPVKSGQQCVTYPKMWVVNWRDRLGAFSKRRVRKWARDAATGRVQRIFPAPPSNRRHPAWTEHELARFEPRLITSLAAPQQ